jgi:hypothetical protein
MFVAVKSTAALSHKKPASTGKSCDSCGARGKDIRKALCTASLPTVQNTSLPSITKTNQLMQSEEITVVYCEKHMKHKYKG